jgi:hypothetical protein
VSIDSNGRRRIGIGDRRRREEAEALAKTAAEVEALYRPREGESLEDFDARLMAHHAQFEAEREARIAQWLRQIQADVDAGELPLPPNTFAFASEAAWYIITYGGHWRPWRFWAREVLFCGHLGLDADTIVALGAALEARGHIETVKVRRQLQCLLVTRGAVS